MREVRARKVGVRLLNACNQCGRLYNCECYYGEPRPMLTNSNVIITLEEMKVIAAELNTLQSKENQGRGINCVRSIVTYLERGDWESAVSIRRTEGDKTRSYPTVEKFLTDKFGCRVHAKFACYDWLCHD